jgi:hypothetical protein
MPISGSIFGWQNYHSIILKMNGMNIKAFGHPKDLELNRPTQFQQAAFGIMHTRLTVIII